MACGTYSIKLSFRNEQVAAPLKLLEAGYLYAGERAPFRNEQVAAPLKQ